MPAQCLMEDAKAFGLPFLTLVISGATFVVVSVFSWWQVRIAREKLRHDLFDRRFAIYMAFHELLVAIIDPEKDDVEPELRKANFARAPSMFLLDAALGAYLEGLHKEAFRLNAMKGLVRGPNLCPPAERAQKASQLAADKLKLADRVAELVQNFERFLKLRDFWRHTNA